MRISHTVPEGERFRARVDFDGPIPSSCPELGNCWLWTGPRAGRYGIFESDTGRMYAHRYRSVQTEGPIPFGIKVCHRCDTPLCVRDSHLFRGTQADNLADMRAKGRGPVGERHGMRLHPERNGMRLHPERAPRGDRNGLRLHPERVARGERNGNAKLTAASVQTIRTRFAAGETQTALSREYGVPQSAISRVILRKAWAHVV